MWTCAALIALVVGCEDLRPTSFDDYPYLLRTPAQFWEETAPVEERVTALALKAEVPGAHADPRLLFADLTEVRASWKRVASHFALGLGEDPVPRTAAFKEAHARWTRALNEVSEGLNEASRFVAEDRPDDLRYWIWRIDRALESLWSQAGVTGVRRSCLKLRLFLLASQSIPLDRRAKIRVELERRMDSGLRRLMEETMDGVVDKEEPAGRLALLARLRAAAIPVREGLAPAMVHDPLPEKCQALFPLLDQIDRQTAPGKE